MISFRNYLEVRGWHGTYGKDFDKFDMKKLGRNTKATITPLGFFFTPSKAEAAYYANCSPRKPRCSPAIVGEWELDIKNPYHMYIKEFDELIDWGGMPKQKYKTAAQARKATRQRRAELEAQGFDGVFVFDIDGTLGEIAIFRPEQAKRIKG